MATSNHPRAAATPITTATPMHATVHLLPARNGVAVATVATAIALSAAAGFAAGFTLGWQAL
ncbi:hypothetical protein AB0C34_17320 [Nocardia sp. NPDC049220]|uniref:hypothetical protein n=1 Tax=Nocardia sp. NPDC049220 TaxID=3155273 RepID=UPI0034072267